MIWQVNGAVAEVPSLLNEIVSVKTKVFGEKRTGWIKMFAQKIEKKKEGKLPRTKAREQKVPQMTGFGGRIESDRKSVWSDSKDNHVWSGERVIQRAVIRFKPMCVKPQSDEAAFDVKARQIDEILQQAHREFLANNFSDASDGYVAAYVLRKKHYDEWVSDMHPSTAAGYVIESKVNHRIEGMDGVSLQNTNLLKGTRPDIVLENGNGQYALLDITASNSIGHVFWKKGNWTGHQNIIYVAELTYPSIDFRRMGAIQLTEEQEDQISQYANEKQNRVQEWKDFCEINLLENQGKILAALHRKCIICKNATERQLEILYSNFGKFGIALILREGFLIMGAKMEDFSLDDVLEFYSPTAMDRAADKIICSIQKGKLVGMGSI